MADSKIEWTEKTWNPITGCTKISEGCRNCYAEPMAKRMKAIGDAGGSQKYKEGFDKVVCHEKALNEPLKWKNPCKIFVCSMSDIFHDDVPFDFIDKIFETMTKCPQHTFMILTKRPKRMREFMRVSNGGRWGAMPSLISHIWFGVTAENQEQANKRIPELLRFPLIPAVKKFVSIEPMLGPIDLTKIQHLEDTGASKFPVIINSLEGTYNITDGYESIEHDKCPKLDWVIVGGESGKGARPMHPDWVKYLQEDCKEFEVPFFFKQWGEYVTFAQVPDENLILNNFSDEDMRDFYKVGKKKAGCLLDGKEYKEIPQKQ